MSLKQLIIMVSIALATIVYIGTAKDEIVKDAVYTDVVNDGFYFVDSGTGENE